MSAFSDALALVLKSEGGQVDNPKDHGGRTNKGITQATYNAWRGKKGLSVRDVYGIADNEVAAIYRAEYADPVWFDKLPAGVGYAVFDFAVNSGVKRAVLSLQACLGVKLDGIFGAQTLQAVLSVGAKDLIAELCTERLHFLQGLSTWSYFGHGWTSRVDSVRKNALAMAATPVAVATTTPKPAPLPPYSPPVLPGPHILPVPAPVSKASAWAAIGAALKTFFFKRDA